MVSASGDSVQIWNASNGEIERKLGLHSGWASGIAIFPNWTRVVVSSDVMRIWKVVTGELESTLDQFGEYFAFSPDGSRVSILSYESVLLWNTTTGKIEHMLHGDWGRVRSIAFSPGGRHVVFGLSSVETVRIWDTVTGKLTSLSESKSFRFPDGSMVTALASFAL